MQTTRLRTSWKRALAVLALSLTFLLGDAALSTNPAHAAWWSYDEGWIAGKLFYYSDCGGGRIVPTYAFWLNNTHYVHVSAYDYWRKRVGDRWSGNPYSSGC